MTHSSPALFFILISLYEFSFHSHFTYLNLCFRDEIRLGSRFRNHQNFYPPHFSPKLEVGILGNSYRIFLEGVVNDLYGNITSVSLTFLSTGNILPLGAALSSALRDPPSEWARRTFRNEENSDSKSSTWVNGLVIFVF